MTKENRRRAKEIRELINLNHDARQYFYEKADETWLDWLWKNDFFHVLREKAEDLTEYSYRTPELHYLVRMAKTAPEKVVQVILDTPISSETFNPEVLDQFIRIAGELPGNYLARIVDKIHAENWPSLMKDFSQWGFEYGEMLKTLEESHQPQDLLKLSRAVLGVRHEITFERHGLVSWGQTPFNIRNLTYTNVFKHLANVPAEVLEEAFALVVSVLGEITLLAKQEVHPEATFAVGDPFNLLEVDIFKLEPSNKHRDTEAEDVKELIATIKVLAQRLIGEGCANETMVKHIYSQVVQPLPDSRLTWRLRLYLFTLCPNVFQKQLKDAFFRIFEVQKHGDLTYGAEYKIALQRGFSVLSNKDKRRYISRAKEYFSRVEQKGDRKRDGSEILSIIRGHLTETEVLNLTNAGFDINLDYAPAPLIGPTSGGWVQHRGPVSLQELNVLPIEVLIENLRTVWNPEELKKQDTQKDFLRPLDAEGLGNLLRQDIPSRFFDYLSCSLDLLPNHIDLHYTYSVLVGFQKVVEDLADPLPQEVWKDLINFCFAIKELAREHPSKLLQSEERVHDTWLIRWNGMLDGMARLMEKTLGKGRDFGFVLETHRKKVFSIIEFLLSCPDPSAEDEKIETAKMTMRTGEDPALVSDPYTIAINSTRGIGFELLVSLVDIEREKFPEEARSKLSTDVKVLYESLLEREQTRAIRFMFGRYLPVFYFLDSSWIRDILQRIFPLGRAHRFLFLATWEGYLVNSTFYSYIFSDSAVRKIYKRAIFLADLKYPDQRHFLQPEEGLGRHFALAYVHHDFGFGDSLFDTFWECGHFNSHEAFVDLLGRLYISGENPKINKLIIEDTQIRERLKEMWHFLLKSYEADNLFKTFGHWASLEKKIFREDELADLIALTLKRTRGGLDWDRDLLQSLPRLASKRPEQTLEIVRLFLLEGVVQTKQNRLPFRPDDVWKEVFTILHKDSSTRDKASDLIDALIREGGPSFWYLKEALNS